MKYLIFDTETGGVNPETNALISIGLIVVNDKLEEITRFHSLIKNGENKKIDEQATAVHNISEETLEQGIYLPRMRKVWDAVSADVGVIIGHNVAFDINFLRANIFDMPTILTLDTMHISWDVWAFQKAKLELVYDRIGKKVENAHDALYDCVMVLDMLRWFVDNKHIELPLPSYPLVTNYFEHKAFGYKKMAEKGLLVLDK